MHSILLQVQLNHNKSKVVNSKSKRPLLEKIATKNNTNQSTSHTLFTSTTPR